MAKKFNNSVGDLMKSTVNKTESFDFVNDFEKNENRTRKLFEPKKKTPPKKQTHKTFTFWVEKNQLATWKAYIDAKGIKSESLGLTAIEYYIKNVEPITQEEEKAFLDALEKYKASIETDERRKSTTKE